MQDLQAIEGAGPSQQVRIGLGQPAFDEMTVTGVEHGRLATAVGYEPLVQRLRMLAQRAAMRARAALLLASPKPWAICSRVSGPRRP
ncbi:conserved hypothetical protein [Ricinus communis]|uniref:Uncharacterized protein n=1 Tax=Ricinus communis TaxID=3988 RepID=B9TD95_RICCO|nr:conserved hypothetical protein [Ricinus communis]